MLSPVTTHARTHARTHAQNHRRRGPEMDGLATCSSAPELRGYHEVRSKRTRPSRNRASGSNRYRSHGHAASRSVRIRGGRRGISKVLLLANQPASCIFKKFLFFLLPLRFCACVFFYIGTSTRF